LAGEYCTTCFRLTLRTALHVVRAGAERFGLVDENEVLSLFIAIDDYQKIPTGPYYSPLAENQSEEWERTFLWKLIAALGNCNSVHGMHIHVGFAGTRWGPISLCESPVCMVRAPLTLLSPSMME
jgi:hypothetical protein